MSENEMNTLGSGDDEIDMGQVSAEDPIEQVSATSGTATAPAKKERKPRQPKAEKEPKEPAAPKVPVVGGYTKLPDFAVTFVDGWEGLWNDAKCPASKHHQRQVIVEVFQAAQANGTIEGETISADKIVTAVEGDAALLARMKTNQPVHRCVLYHLNQLEIMGIVTTTRQRRAAGAKKAEAENVSDSGVKSDGVCEDLGAGETNEVNETTEA